MKIKESDTVTVTKKEIFFFMNYLRLLAESDIHNLEIDKFFFSSKCFNLLKKMLGITEEQMDEVFEILNEKRNEIMNQFNQFVNDIKRNAIEKDGLAYCNITSDHPLFHLNLEEIEERIEDSAVDEKKYAKSSKFLGIEEN